MLRTRIKTIAEATGVTVTVVKMNGIIDDMEGIRVKAMAKQCKHVGFAI